MSLLKPMGNGPRCSTSFKTISPSATTIIFASRLPDARKGRPETRCILSLLAGERRLAYKDEKFPSNNIAVGRYFLLNTFGSSATLMLSKLINAGVPIARPFALVDNNTVFRIPSDLTVSIELTNLEYTG